MMLEAEGTVVVMRWLTGMQDLRSDEELRDEEFCRQGAIASSQVHALKLIANAMKKEQGLGICPNPCSFYSCQLFDCAN